MQKLNVQGSSIYIIGSGAIGKSLAVFLRRDKKNVVLLRGSVDDQSRHLETISVMLNDGTVLEEEVEVSTLSNFATLDGIIVLANKSYGNKNLSMLLKGKTARSPIVLLQNGLGIERPFIDNDFSNIYRCVLFVTSQRMGADKIRFKPVSTCPVGIIKGNHDELNGITETLSSKNFQFIPEDAIQSAIWKKAIINCAFNSICPVLETDNGIFHRNPVALNIAQKVIQECVMVARRVGVPLDETEVLRSLLMISRSSDGQLISTLQDIRNHRQTEIETLNFEVVSIAKALDMEDQVKETQLLGELTRLKSELTMISSPTKDPDVAGVQSR